MGLKDLFSSEGRSAGRMRKHIARARNKDAQSADRFASLEALRDDASPEAVDGLLGRFTIRYDKSIEDEQEKEWVFDELCQMGAKILPPLQKHLRYAESIAWGLKVLHEVASQGRGVAHPRGSVRAQRQHATRAIRRRRSSSSTTSASTRTRAAAKALVPYLEDMDEGVRFIAVEGLLRHKDAEAAREPLLKLLTNPKEESRRIKKRIVDGFADLGWDVKGYSGTVEKMLADLLPGARLDNHGKIKRKPQK